GGRRLYSHRRPDGLGGAAPRVRGPRRLAPPRLQLDRAARGPGAPVRRHRGRHRADPDDRATRVAPVPGAQPLYPRLRAPAERASPDQRARYADRPRRRGRVRGGHTMRSNAMIDVLAFVPRARPGEWIARIAGSAAPASVVL